MPLINRLFLFLLLPVLGACSNARLQSFEASLLPEQKLLVLDTPPFLLLAAVQHTLHSPGKHLRIYLEGDGHAWVTPQQPSLDPTPRQDWFARLALSDPQPAAWLARPCQYIRNESCHVNYWTRARFSEEVLAATNQAVEQVKQIYGSEQLELVGYSGGATLALLLAARRDDVVAVQTLAGNLSPRLWSQQQSLTPLHDSLDPLDQLASLRALPQRHLVGRLDKTVPASLARQWQNLLGSSHCSEVIVLPGLDHSNNWVQAWQSYRKSSPKCPAPDLLYP